MDWELYERYRATLVLVAVAFISFLLLIFQHTSSVHHIRSLLVSGSLPVERFLSGPNNMETGPLQVEVSTTGIPAPMVPAEATTGSQVESLRTIDVLRQENKRLHELFNLQQGRWPKAIAAQVVGRDPQRWFEEIVLDKGKEDGIAMDDPVVAVVSNREGLVGRITDVSAHVSKVMLIQDSLSSVAATIQGSQDEDGVVEGSNSHSLLLKFLDRSSTIKVGDPVVTSGLGKVFPAGIPLGFVQEIGLDQRQLFLQAQLHPAVQANQLHWVLILIRRAEDAKSSS
jgi:rod shape-determining protein MreC